MLKTFCFFCSCMLFSIAVFANDVAYFIQKGDSAYLAFNHAAARDFFQHALETDSLNYEAAWKLSRAFVDYGENLPEKDDRRVSYENARKYADYAIAIAPDSAKGYLFLSIALGRVALDAGAKERVQLSKDIRAAVDRSLELDPNEDIAWHVLGRWNRKIATLSWVERNFANIFLGGVPKDASVERSVECFKKAIELAPNTLVHWLELGISYEKLKMKDEARIAFEKVLELPVSDSDDAGHKAHAKKLLSEL
ncbi:MAG: hypothetical protein R3C41_04315 [Calditrichia bacterium]|nr:hypothetical protein [Calditrichota bacterium]